MRVLLVDDELDYACFLAERLHLRGVLTLIAGDGEEALAVARREAPDAAIVDLQMPGMGGLECIAKLQELRPGLRAALLTSADDAMAIHGAQALGCAFFQKNDMKGFWDFISLLQRD